MATKARKYEKRNRLVLFRVFVAHCICEMSCSTRVTIAATMRIGVDLGGTKIEGIAIADDGAAVVRRRVPTPRGDYRETLTAIATVVAEIERDCGERGTVGVGIPGTISAATGL